MHPPKCFPFSLHSTPKENFHETLSEHYATRLGMAVTFIWQTGWLVSELLCVSFMRETLL